MQPSPSGGCCLQPTCHTAVSAVTACGACVCTSSLRSGVHAAGEDTALAPLTRHVNDALATLATDPVAATAALENFGRTYVDKMLQQAAAAAARASKAKGSSSTSASAGSASGSDGGSNGDGAAAAERPIRIVDKMLRNLWLVGYIQLLLPDACVVHVVRHPMDAGLSCYSQPFGYSGMPWSWDLGDIAAQVNMTWELADHWDKALPGESYQQQLPSVNWPSQAADRCDWLLRCPLPLRTQAHPIRSAPPRLAPCMHVRALPLTAPPPQLPFPLPRFAPFIYPSGRVLTVHYEDLVSDVEGVARELMAHCGLGWEEGVLDFHSVQRPVATASVAQVRVRERRARVGLWVGAGGTGGPSTWVGGGEGGRRRRRATAGGRGKGETQRGRAVSSSVGGRTWGPRFRAEA